MKFPLLVLLMMLTALPASAEDLPPFSPVTDEAPLRKLLINFSELKDPFTVQFRRLEIRKITAASGTAANVWCGQLNAKNSNGAYIGWFDFAVVEAGEKPIVSIANGDTADVSEIAINHFCQDASIRTKR